MKRPESDFTSAFKASRVNYICDGITDNRSEWKQKEFERLFPNTDFSDYESFCFHFSLHKEPIKEFNLREFKKEYECSEGGVN